VEFSDIVSRWSAPRPVPGAVTDEVPVGAAFVLPVDTVPREVAEAERVQLHSIATHLLYVTHQVQDKLLSGSSLREAYFGNFNAHPTFLRQDKDVSLQRPIELPPLARVIGGIHGVYRVTLPKQLAVQLDVDRLTPETREAVDNIHRYIADYQEIIKTQPVSSEFNQIGVERVAALKRCELGRSDSIIPILMDGKRLSVPNANDLGIFLYGLELSRYAQLDGKKMPQELVDMMRSYVGGAAGIVKNIEQKYDAIPQLRAQREKAYHECLPKILTLLRTHAHALQVANLVAQTGAIGALLYQVGLPEYPKRLQSVKECAMVLECAGGHCLEQKDELEALSHQLLAMERGERSAPDAHLLKALSEMKSDRFVDQHQFNLCRDFLAGRGLMAGRSTTLAR
jgi:hypothetical protein